MHSTADHAKSSPNNNQTVAGKSGEAPEAAMARKAYDPVCRAVLMARDVSSLTRKRGLNEAAEALHQQLDSIRRGDLAIIEGTLAVQANSLDLVFNDMLRRAAANAGTYLQATETYMRMALKAQSQCRATLETLAAIKNPPVVIAKQANISAGPQQVNNCVPGPAGTKTIAATSEPTLAAPMLAHEHGLPLAPSASVGKPEQTTAPELAPHRASR